MTHDIPMLFISRTGEVQGSVFNPYSPRLPKLRRAQARFNESPRAMQFAKQLLLHKAERQARNVRSWWVEVHKHRQHAFDSHFKAAMEGISEVSGDDWRMSTMGLEGALSRAYWKEVSAALPEEWAFTTRSRRPATSAFNALLNYAYGMLYHEVEVAILTSGFDPSQGILHADGYQRSALAFDLVEPFRPVIDFQCVKLVCDPDAPGPNEWTTTNEGAVALNRFGKTKLIPHIRSTMKSQVHLFGQTATFRNHVARLLASFEQHVLDTFDDDVLSHL